MKILIAEDDTSIAEAYKDALETRNHEIIMTENGEECLKKYQTGALLCAAVNPLGRGTESKKLWE